MSGAFQEIATELFPEAEARMSLGALASVTGLAAITDDLSPAADVVEIRK